MTRTRALSAAIIAASLLDGGARALAQRPELPPENRDEANVHAYTLPDPLTAADGTRITTARAWRAKRRPEVLRLFQEHVYGRSPGRPGRLKFVTGAVDRQALGGKATRKHVRILFDGKDSGPQMELMLYLPNGARRPVPAFVGLNFRGNQAVSKEPGVPLSTQWMRNTKDGTVVDHRATEASRGAEATRWPVELIISRGYALATAYYGDIDPDFHDGYKNGVQPLFYEPGQTAPAPDEWGSVGAWAWGLSRAMDYFETDRVIDAKHVAVVGHSRLGKTALWAGAQDERIAMVISNNSGETGASLARRNFGETVEAINVSYPHWFCGNYKKYNRDVAALPVDQHMLIALSAPRPVYVASAVEDPHSDPRGEFLAAKGAEPVYGLFGRGGLGVDDLPPVDRPVGETIGYHLRTGKHDMTEYDWQQYLAFADRHFKRSAR